MLMMNLEEVAGNSGSRTLGAERPSAFHIDCAITYIPFVGHLSVLVPLFIKLESSTPFPLSLLPSMTLMLTLPLWIYVEYGSTFETFSEPALTHGKGGKWAGGQDC
jgi:hypothetical protein